MRARRPPTMSTVAFPWMRGRGCASCDRRESAGSEVARALDLLPDVPRRSATATDIHRKRSWYSALECVVNAKGALPQR
jgi:hypothetical protein